MLLRNAVRANSARVRVRRHLARWLCASIASHDSGLLQGLGIPWATSPPNHDFPGLRQRLANPCGQCPTTGIAQCTHRCGNAAIVSEVVLDSRLLLRLRVFGDSARIAHMQIEPLLVFAVPVLQGILGWVTQLTNGRPDAFAGLDVQLDRSNPVFV